MTTSGYLPDLKVEIAWNGSPSTAMSTWTWSDVSAYVELRYGVVIGFGRRDQFTSADANTLSLTLDNSDGRFTPLLASSPNYPNVKIGKPIRVTATPVGGSARTRFVGFIDQWPTEWGDKTTATNQVKLTATSRRARLAGTADSNPAAAVYESYGATAVWPLWDDAGPWASSTPDLVAPCTSYLALPSGFVHEDAAPGANWLDDDSGAVVVTFNDQIQVPVTVAASQAFSMIVIARLPRAPKPMTILGAVHDDSPSDWLQADLDFDPDGQLAIRFSTSAGIAYGDASACCDGHWHVYCITRASGAAPGLTCYVDGTLSASLSGASSPTFTSGVVAGQFSPGGSGEFARLAAFVGTELSQSQVAAISSALIIANGETPGARLSRYAARLGVASADTSFDVGTAPLAQQTTKGQDYLSLMEKVAFTEGGVLFDSPDGVLTFRSFSDRYSEPLAVTIDAAAQELESDFRADYSRESIINDYTATGSSGASARASDTTSADAYGVYAKSGDMATDDANHLAGRAQWYVTNYAAPKVQGPSVTVMPGPLGLSKQAAILAMTLGSRMRVQGLPAQSPVSSYDYFVEGWTESYGLESWSLTFNVTDAAVIINSLALVLDSATAGKLDTNKLA